MFQKKVTESAGAADRSGDMQISRSGQLFGQTGTREKRPQTNRNAAGAVSDSDGGIHGQNGGTGEIPGDRA